MQPSKWEVWPWNWRKVRKARISKEDRDLFERYGETVVASILASNPSTTEIHAYIAGQDYEPSSQGRRPAARDWLTECRDAHELREQRVETVEIGVVALITLEILLSFIFGAIGIYEGLKQGEALDRMARSTADTAATMQTVRDELKSLAADQAKTREILQQQEADRLAQAAKKPKPVLYVGHVLLAKPHGPLKPSQESDTSAIFDFVLRNVGDANANKVTFRVLVPPDAGGVSSNTSFFPIYPASDLPDRPVRAFLLHVDSLRAKNYVQFSLTFVFPKSHPPFQVMFNVDADEIETDTPLGTFMITPRKPAKDESSHPQ
jgi:hypothetical protein